MVGIILLLMSKPANLFRTSLPQARAINRVSANIILTAMVLRVSLLMRLRRAYTSVRKLSLLVHLARGWVDGSALGFGECAVVAGTRA